MATLALGQAEDFAAKRHFLVGQAVEAADHFGARAEAQHAIDRGDLLLHILRLPEQTPEHFAVDRHRAPRDVGVGQHADQRGMLEGVQLFLAKPHQLAAARLPIAQVIEGLGDDGLVEWVWCGHAGLPRSRSRVRSAGVQVEQTAGQPQQPEQLDQCGVAQSPGCVALSVQQRRQVDDELPVIQADVGGLLTGHACQQRQDGTAQRLQVLGVGTAGETDAVWTVIDALVQASLARDLAGELRDVDAQALGRVQARVDVPDVGNRVETACLDGNGLQDVGREIGQRIPSSSATIR